MEFGKKIAYYRKSLNITQDALAKQLGISNQAVSKWETDQSCPDVELLPKLAEILGISLDELFQKEWTVPLEGEQVENGVVSEDTEQKAREKETGAENDTALTLVSGTAGLQLPWEDDGNLRAVLFVGRQLVQQADVEGKYGEICKDIKLNIDGATLNVESYFNVCCGDVCGNVIAKRDVNCGDVEGSVACGRDVNCEDVNGPVSSGNNVNCGDVEGDLAAGNNVECGDVGGNIAAGNSVSCGDVEGDISAGSSVACCDVEGDISAGSSVACADVEGNVKANGDVNCGDVDGNVSAENNVECGDVKGRVRAGGKVNGEEIDN